MKSNRYPIIGLIVILFASSQTGFCDGYKDARKELEHNSRPWFVKDHIQRALQDNSSSFYYEDIQPEIDKFLSDYENQKQLPFESMIHEIEPFLQGSVSKELQQKSTSGDFDELFSKDVTLETVVSLVYARSPYIQSANSAFQAALERYPQAVYLEGILQQYNAFTKRLDLLLGGMQLHKQMVDSDFPFPGMTALRGDMVQTDIDIAKQEYAITVRDVFANAKTAFYELVYIQRSIEITLENQILLEQLLHVASQKFEAGNTTYNDVIQARVALAKLSNNLITQQNQQQTLRTYLNSLMNRLPGAPFGHAIQPDESKANLQLEPLYQLAKQNRQEIKKAELQIQRITQMIEMARIKNRPEPTTGTSYFLDRNALLAGSEKDYEAFQPVPMQQIRPWFGQRESFIAEMLEQKQEMQSKLKSVINQTEYEVKEAHFTLDKAQREVSLYQTTLLDDARQSLEIAESDYLGARIDFLDYLTAQQNWHDFNLSYYMAQRDVGIAKVKLERVIGSSLHQALSDTQPQETIMNMISKLLQYKMSYLIAGIVLTLIFSSLFSGGGHDHKANVLVESSAPTKWTCSMHPQIQKTEPGKCDICGMDLIPLKTDEDNDSGPRTLKMSEAAKQLANIQTVAVKREYVEHELRLVGKVEYDETRLKYITAWFPGRLDRLFVDYTGTPVKSGDHLVEIYSPSILTDQEALLQAKQAASRSSISAVNPALANRSQTFDRARERLRLLGLTEQQIADIEAKGEASERVNFYSPIDGVVVHKNALEGDYVQTGSRIYTIADLSHIWIKLDAYESDLEWIHYGQEVEFTTAAHPGDVFTGRVSFIDPFLNEQTRTVKIRVNVDNHDGMLKPEMFVRAVVHGKVNAAGEIYDQVLAGKWISPMHPEIIKDEPGTCDVCGMALVKAETLGFVSTDDNDHEPPLVIPSSAPLITGKRAVVYVKVPNTEKPTFEGREIVLGPRLKDHYIVHAGLEEGDEVVIKGNFKIDSALQIQAKPSMMNPQGGGSMGVHQHDEQMPQTEMLEQSLPSISDEALPDLLSAYQPIYKALVNDDLSSAQQASNDWVAAAKKHSLNQIEVFGHGVMHANGLDKARESFKQISDALIQAAKQNIPKNETLYFTHCPMAFNNTGADWIQWDDKVLNPYFGDAMLTCGSVTETLMPEQQSETNENNQPHQH